MNREIYFDNSSTTRPYDEVVEYISSVYREFYGNPSSLHRKGIEAEKLVKNARSQIMNSLETEKGQVYFTSGGTESNNLAILGYLKANRRAGRHVVTSKIEHPSVLEIFKYLVSEGYKTDFVDVDKSGIIDLEKFRSVLTDETVLVSIMMVNNETGAIQPIEEIAEIMRFKSPKAKLHVDAIQAYGKLRINPEYTGISLMSISSHKIHGPKGVGVLYTAPGVKLSPIMYGGGQENALRSGTENVPGICGFGLASEITFRNMDENRQKVQRIKDKLAASIKESIKDAVIISPEKSSPYILNISFPGVKAEVLLHHLEQKGIFVSTGSACSSRKNIRSHVLQAMGLPGDIIDGSIRMSFSSFNEEEEVLPVVSALEEIVPKITTRR